MKRKKKLPTNDLPFVTMLKGAKMYGLHRETLYRAIQSGKLKAFSIDGAASKKTVLHIEHLRLWVESRRGAQ